MTTTCSGLRRNRLLVVTLVFAFAVALTAPVRGAQTAQQHFASPDEAAQALAESFRSGDKKAVLRVLGSAGERLINSGDPVADADAATRFVQAYDEAHSLVNTNDTTVTLQIGKTEWPLPIPLVKEEKGWRFDSAAGEQELLNRRIGHNENFTIQACLAYVDAQREYYQRNPQRSALLHYASRIQSTKGTRDGLYWEVASDEEPSPLGEEFARARAAGYEPGKSKPAPFHGYYYRILTAQGPDAPGGAYDYMAQGKMIGGFALIAYPARYASSGVMTFMVSHAGEVFQRDLGPQTASIASSMKTFNPTHEWQRVGETDVQ